MTVARMCKYCGRSIIVWSTAQSRCPKCQLARSKAKPPKPIKQRGKEAQKWASFRNKVAVPYLDENFGHVCSVPGCMETDNLDVDHVLTRGAHPELKYDVNNLRYLCREHHRLQTDGKLRLKTG